MKLISAERKACVLVKLLPPYSMKVTIISRMEGIAESTLYNWLNRAKKEGKAVPKSEQVSSTWSSEVKFAVIVETATLSETELVEYCHKKGLYPVQIMQWKEAFLQAPQRTDNAVLKQIQQEMYTLMKKLHNIIKLNQKLNRVEIKEFELDNQIVFSYFDRLSENQRSDALVRAIYIGVLALMEDRISAFLSKTSNELGTELESLKMIFDIKKELFYKSTIKGVLAEDDIAEFLNQYFSDKRLKDRAYLTGNMAGVLPKNKTGDIVCELDGNSQLKIVIECKFDKSIRLGDIGSKEIFTRQIDTAWSQLIEAEANRDAKVSIIVFDISLVDSSIVKLVDNVGYVADIGFIAIVDSQKGDYSNLAIAYMLARDIAINAKQLDFDKDMLLLLISRIIKDINEVLTIKNLIVNNIENNKTILKQLEKSILLMEFNQEYMKKFLSDGSLTTKDLLDFYLADDIKSKYREVEKEIGLY